MTQPDDVSLGHVTISLPAMRCAACASLHEGVYESYTPYIVFSTGDESDGAVEPPQVPLDVQSMTWIRRPDGQYEVIASASFECGICATLEEARRQLEAPALVIQRLGVCSTHGAPLQLERLQVDLGDLDARPSPVEVHATLSCALCRNVISGVMEVAGTASGELAADAAVGVERRGEAVAVFPGRVDVLVAVATDVEVEKVLATFPQAVSVPFQWSEGSLFDLGVVGGKRVGLVRSEAGSGGPSGSAMTLSQTIRALRPRAVFLTGICFGVVPGKQSIGDIIVSTQVLLYEPQRVGTTAGGRVARVLRGDRVSASAALLSWCRAAMPSWRGSTVHFGQIVSGEKLVDNLHFRTELRNGVAAEAIGGEMEAAGLYAAASRSGCDWIVVKGIADWADGEKSRNKRRRQERAATASAEFVHHVIAQALH